MIELPWPHKALSPNARPHHLAKWKQVKAHRQWAYLATLAAKISVPEGTIRVTITAYPKVERGRDRDNMVAWCKSYLDGIADGLGVNDTRFQTPVVQWGECVARPVVVVTIG